MKSLFSVLVNLRPRTLKLYTNVNTSYFSPRNTEHLFTVITIFNVFFMLPTNFVFRGSNFFQLDLVTQQVILSGQKSYDQIKHEPCLSAAKAI